MITLSPLGFCRWRQAIGLALGLVAAATSPGATAGAPAPDPTPDALGAHARGVLHQIMTSERSWVRIHAAEALIAAGEGEAIRAYFLSELPTTESSAFRIGVCRVLATTAHSVDERNTWIAKAESAYCDVTAPDRNQAIETLCKLGHRVSGPALAIVRQNAAGPPSAPMALALWASQIAGEPRALEGLTGLLTSDNPALRTSAAYALRWLHPSDPAVRGALARAVADEPAGANVTAYLLSAALTAGADPAQTADWETKLKQALFTGAMPARFEACWTLRHRYQVADLPQVAPLLDLPATENDTRVGAAMIILTILARH